MNFSQMVCIYTGSKKCFMPMFLLAFLLLASCKSGIQTASNKKLITLDSASIAGWEFKPGKAEEGSAYKVVRNDGAWMVLQADATPAEADAGYLNRSFKHLLNMNALNQLNVKKENWDTLGVDEKGTQITVLSKDGKTRNQFIIGKMFFLNNKTTYYVRLADEDKIYTVQQYFDGSLKAPASKFRKKEMVPLQPLQVADVLFLNPQGIDYILKKAGQLNWEVDGYLANDSAMVNYLKKLLGLQIKEFGQQPVTGVELSIEIKTTDGTPPVWLRASRKNSDTWTITSSANRGNYLEMSSAELSALFPPKTYFLQSTKK